MRPSEAESSKGVEKGALGSLAHSTASGTDAALIARGAAWRAGDDCVRPMPPRRAPYWRLSWFLAALQPNWRRPRSIFEPQHSNFCIGASACEGVISIHPPRGETWRPRSGPSSTGTPRTADGAPRWCGDSSSIWRPTMRCLNTEESHTTQDVLPHRSTGPHLTRDALPHHTGPHGLRKLEAAVTHLSPSWRRTLGRRARVHTSRPLCMVRTAPANSPHSFLSPAADTWPALPMQALQAGYTLPGCSSSGRTESAGRNRS